MKLMMLGSLSSYCQYPTIKTIEKDTVVIMTVKQGKDINRRFTMLSDSIQKINKDFENYIIVNDDMMKKLYYSYLNEYNGHNITKAKSDSFRVMYLANKKIYLNAEQDHKREIRHLSILTLVSFIVTIILAAQ